MGRLNQSEYMPHAPITPGTEHVNHEDCPAGVDTKRRLYVTRKEDNSVVAYCHNCGNSGGSRGASRYRVARLPKPPSKSEEGKLEMSGEYLWDDPIMWPRTMIEWLRKCGVPLTTAKKYGIVYDSDDKRIVLPKFNREGELVMYQSRRIYDDGSPKYLTYKEEGAYYHDPVLPRGVSQRQAPCIVVEDMISAIRCAEVGYDACPLFTSTMDDETLLTLTKEYDTIIVWLDNDSDEVRDHAVDIKRRIQNTGTGCRWIGISREPKHYDNERINGIIKEIVE